MKYWDAASASWVLIGGMSSLTTALPTHGGKLFGPLRVTGALTTTGVAHAGFYSNTNTSALLDASIKLTGRTVRFGNCPVKRLGAPVSPGDLATNTYLTTRSSAEVDRQVLPYLHEGAVADGDYDPLTVHRSSDGLITVQGLIVLNIQPGSVVDSILISVLPDGMRPSAVKLFPVFGNGTMYRCEISPDGDIRLIFGSAGLPADSRIVISGACFYPS